MKMGNKRTKTKRGKRRGENIMIKVSSPDVLFPMICRWLSFNSYLSRISIARAGWGARPDFYQSNTKNSRFYTMIAIRSYRAMGGGSLLKNPNPDLTLVEIKRSQIRL